MPHVLIKRATYRRDALQAIISEMIESVAPGIISPGARVLIKPNLLLAAAPAAGIVTHPEVVRATVAYVLEKGGRPLVADSPAIGGFQRILKTSGYTDALGRLPVEMKPFQAVIPVDIGKPFGRIEIARDAVAADVVINLAKLKTHVQMLLTLGVKNMFGCVVGLQKPEWHLRSGIDRHMFARLLVQICHHIAPAVTLIDGVTALEGQGPGKGGRPRQLGLLVASDRAYAADYAVIKMLGVAPRAIATHHVARQLGLVGGGIDIRGDFTGIEHFLLPDPTPPTFGPQLFQRQMRRHLTQRPRAKKDLCRQCGDCWRYCPAQAVHYQKDGLRFDYDRCIRCYCCIEVCPHGALEAAETFPGRILRKFRGSGGT